MKGSSLQVFGIILAFLCSAPLVRAAGEVTVHWEYFVVSTPDFDGAFRGHAPGFRPPVPQQVTQPKLRVHRAQRAWGTFEAIVDTDGKTTPERSLIVSSPAVKRQIEAIISRWRFEPATLEDQPIRVRLRITVYAE
jgi:hypothetical protein